MSITLLVLMTLLPLVVYLYLESRGRMLAGIGLAEQVEANVSRTLQLREAMELVLEEAEPTSDAVRQELERLVMSANAIAYLQLADREGRVLNSTSGAPERATVPVLALPTASSEEVMARLENRKDDTPPEYVVDLLIEPKTRGHIVVGMSVEDLGERLKELQQPVRFSALQIAVICMAILAAFSAYIIYLNERARTLQAQLQEESRLAYIGTLAASIAHEVRNPLSSVKMNVQMMENKLRKLDDPERSEYFLGKIERVNGEIERLEDAVGHFLAFARPAALALEAASLNDVVARVLDFLQPQCSDRGVQIVRRLGKDLPPVRLDPNQFAQAMQNLVLNALQALDRGGTITVTTERTNGSVGVVVADDGPGIDQEAQKHIFDVFFTTREGGTGLGLNIVNRIVEEHRGRLSVESREGEGASFRIELDAQGSEEDA
jgi:signal transduction histidine kinase